MKRLFFLIIILIMLISHVYAEDQISVRFHSFGKNATIDLKQFLGKSREYISSQSDNVIIVIDQKEGIAELYARPGWSGSETVFFSSIETISSTTNSTLLSIFQIGDIERYMIGEEEISAIIEDNLDEGLKERIDVIHHEEITNLDSRVENGEVILNINEEINFKINLTEERPKINIEFVTQKETSQTVVLSGVEEEFNIAWIIIPAMVILSLILIAFIISRREEIIKSIEEVGIKRRTINKLKNIQTYDKKGSEKFIRVINDFFYHFFYLRYDFKQKELRQHIKESKLKTPTKVKVIQFINELSPAVFRSAEDKLSEIHDKREISPEKLKILIKKAIKLIKRI